MTRKVLDIGQCDADNYRIAELLKQHFNVELTRAHTHAEAIQLTNQESFDLILINRLYDLDQSEGQATLETIKSNEATQNTPTILVSNFPDAQAAATAAGAEPGFGKRALNDSATIELLRNHLG